MTATLRAPAPHQEASVAEPVTGACQVCSVPQDKVFSNRGFDYVKCPRCALVSTVPLPTPEQIEGHYAEKFRHGNYSLLRHYAQAYIRGVYMGFVQRLGAVRADVSLDFSGVRVLDVGCFTGDFLGLLAERGAEVMGLELQDEAVALANKHIPGKVFKADVFGDRFPQGPFDIVTLLGVVEHVTDPLKLIRRAAALLEPGGIVMIQTPNAGSLLARLLGRYWPPYAPIEHIHIFSEQSLVAALQSVGFVDIQVTPHWKKLPVNYIYNQFQNFGPIFYRLFAPLMACLPRAIKEAAIPAYMGEMLVTARWR